MDKMTPQEVREIRQRLGLDYEGLRIRLGLKHKDTVRAWESGKTPVQGPVALSLRLIDRLTRESKAAFRAVLDGLWTGA